MKNMIKGIIAAATLLLTSHTFAQDGFSNPLSKSCLDKVKSQFELIQLQESLKTAGDNFAQLTSSADDKVMDQLITGGHTSWATSSAYKGTSVMTVDVKQLKRSEYDRKNNTDLIYIDLCYSFIDDPVQRKAAAAKGEITGACGNPMAVHVNSQCRIVRTKVNTF